MRTSIETEETGPDRYDVYVRSGTRTVPVLRSAEMKTAVAHAQHLAKSQHVAVVVKNRRSGTAHEFRPQR